MSEAASRMNVSIEGSSVVVDGDIDAHSCPELAAALDPLPGAGEVRIDLSAVGFMDSSGLRALIGAHQRAEAADRRIVIAAPSSAVKRLIEISGLGDHLHVSDNS